MNERIKKLAKKAGFNITQNEVYTSKLEHLPITEDMEKLAELIVRECVAQCEVNSDHSYLGPGSKISAFNIKQHFGVKE
jgi:hypothetical protein